MTTEQDNRAFATAERLARRMGGTFVPHEQDNRALVDEPVDSGMNADAVDRAEWLWANLPTRRKWTSLPTHEQALVCHVVAARAPDARIAELERMLAGLVEAVNTNELASAMAVHSITSFCNVEDALKPALAYLAAKDQRP